MPQSLTQTLISQLQGAPIQQIAQKAGIDPAKADSAVSTALPLLLGALGRNGTQPQNAQALFGAVKQFMGDGGGLAGALGSMLGGQSAAAAAGTAAGNGAGAAAGHDLLQGLLGDAHPRIAQGIGQATGLDSGKAGQVLAALAPVVMSFLAQHSAKQGLDANGLGQALSQEHDQVRQQPGAGGMLDTLLDQNGDGRLDAGDLLKFGAGLFGKR